MRGANRSDQHEEPERKLTTVEGLLDTKKLIDSFLTADELTGFGRGKTATTQTIEGPTDDLEAFVRAARSRLIRIYGAWYNADGLDIGFLTGSTER